MAAPVPEIMDGSLYVTELLMFIVELGLHQDGTVTQRF
jgi:hypothetical protein